MPSFGGINLTGASGPVGDLFRFRQDQIADAAGAGTLNIAQGTTFAAQNDLNRLEVIPANEREGVATRLGTAVDAIQRVSDRTDETRRAGEASARAGASVDRDAAQFERATRGLDLSDRQKRAAKARFSLRRAVAEASASGEARRGATDRAKAANRAGGGFSDLLFSQRLQGESDIASAFAADTAAAAERKANKRSGLIGTIGGIAGSALAFFSSEELKNDHGAATGDLLTRLKKVRVNKWNYKGDKRRHVGPFAEEFNREMGLDTDRPDMINVIDAVGITLGAVKELNEKVEAHGR